MNIPDGLAHGKHKIIQFNTVDGRTGEEQPPVIFEYYLEYDEDGVVVIRTEGCELYVNVKAVLLFADYFRDRLEEHRVVHGNPYAPKPQGIIDASNLK